MFNQKTQSIPTENTETQRCVLGSYLPLSVSFRALAVVFFGLFLSPCASPEASPPPENNPPNEPTDYYWRGVYSLLHRCSLHYTWKSPGHEFHVTVMFYGNSSPEELSVQIGTLFPTPKGDVSTPFPKTPEQKWIKGAFSLQLGTLIIDNNPLPINNLWQALGILKTRPQILLYKLTMATLVHDIVGHYFTHPSGNTVECRIFTWRGVQRFIFIIPPSARHVCPATLTQWEGFTNIYRFTD